MSCFGSGPRMIIPASFLSPLAVARHIKFEAAPPSEKAFPACVSIVCALAQIGSAQSDEKTSEPARNLGSLMWTSRNLLLDGYSVFDSGAYKIHDARWLSL